MGKHLKKRIKMFRISKKRILVPIVLFFVIIFLLNHLLLQEEQFLFEKLKYDAMELRLADRRDFVHSMCHQLKLDIPGNDLLHKLNSWEFMINDEYKLIWCNLFKAASTSWMYNFNLLAGYSVEFLNETDKHPLELARRKYPRPSIDDLRRKLDMATSFMIIRHPFERLLAAYRHQLLGIRTVKSMSEDYRFLAQLIISKFRDPNVIPKQLTPTFSEFVQYIIDIFQRRDNGEGYINIDMHWVPMTEYCSPCLVQFDYILNYNAIEEEQAYFIKKMRLSSILKPQTKNKSIDNSVRDLVEKEFSTLTKNQITKLFVIYKYDFILFNYSIDEYLKYGIDEG